MDSKTVGCEDVCWICNAESVECLVGVIEDMAYITIPQKVLNYDLIPDF